MSAKQNNIILRGEYTPQRVYLNNNFYKSFNFRTIILIGGRGIGKTYGVLRNFVKSFIYRGHQFVWLRLTEAECDIVKQDGGTKFLDEVCNSFKYPVKYDIVNETVYLNNKVAGYIIPLSTYRKYKGNNYMYVRNIALDEFIEEKGSRIFYNKVRAYLNSIETILRTRKNATVYLMANSLDNGDSILKLFNFNLKDYGYYINKNKSCICLYLKNSEKYNDLRKGSISQMTVEGTEYEEQIVNNQFSTDFIVDKKPSRCTFLCNCYINNATFTCWIKDNIYVTELKPNEKRPVYTSNIKELVEGVSMINKIIWEKLKGAYARNKVYFESNYLKNLFLQFIDRYKK